MARPRKTSSSKPSSGKTSFGKRTKAENEFRGRKKGKSEDRFGSERPRSSRSSSFRKEDGSERPFRRTGGPFSAKPGGLGFSKKPFQKPNADSNEERPFKKSSSFGARSERPTGFGKRPFAGKDTGKERPFRKTGGPFESKPESRERFEKKSFGRKDDEGAKEKPFGKRESKSFDARPERPSRFEKKPFEKKRFDRGESKPFDRKNSPASDSRPSGFGKKPVVRKDASGEEKPFEKSSSYGLPYKRKPFDKERDVKSTKRKTDDKPKSDSDLIRLNKFMANSGVGSRREADELIKLGLVTVNGETITEMGHKVKPTDDVRYEGKKLKRENPVYVLLNKPKGFITTTDDPQDRNTVMNLVANAGKERIYPVGRLDRNTTGLLLLTNDGELADKLTHPSYNVKKIYRVELDRPLTKNDFIKIQEGVHLEEGKAIVDDLAMVDGDPNVIGIELHIGWNRIVRRIFESLKYEVIKLDRGGYAGLDKKDLGRGQWRFLKPEEIVKLKHFK